MSQKATYHVRDSHFDYYCIIPHLSQEQVLMIRSEKGWTLPHFVPYEHHYGVVGHINQEIKAQLELDTTTLGCVYDSEIDDENYKQESKNVYRVYAMENHSTFWIPPIGASWMDFHELDSLRFANPKLHPILKSWVNEIKREKNSKVRSPWAEIGWFSEVATWINLQLNFLELGAIISLEQIINWELSCLLKAKTRIGNIYFKASSAAFQDEPSKTNLLTQLYPTHLPNLLAINTDKRWMLMEEFTGDLLAEITDIDSWQQALRSFAHMQIKAVDEVNKLLDLGFPDARLDRLIPQIESLLTNTRVLLLKQERGLSETDLETLRSLIPQLKVMCDELAACGIPQTLVHGDFHGHNVVSSSEGYIYFDWSYAAISHPFFDFVYLLQVEEKQLPDVADVQGRLRDAYLEPWTVYLPMQQLIEIFNKAQPLTFLYRAIIDSQVVENMEEECKRAWEGVAPYWLKTLLKQIQSSSSTSS
ncbi:MAG: aminoglycoside phosphotransferase family protein [Xenococcaceae cyanobacterium MO_188.B29]|nr:aminoglycoside phosphotransferase family protein [Xenococcaceae cyanobacterium MO_188.B29]